MTGATGNVGADRAGEEREHVDVLGEHQRRLDDEVERRVGSGVGRREHGAILPSGRRASARAVGVISMIREGLNGAGRAD